MSDEQREQGRDEAPAASRTDQHPVPSYAGAPALDAEHPAGGAPGPSALPPHSPPHSPW